MIPRHNHLISFNNKYLLLLLFWPKGGDHLHLPGSVQNSLISYLAELFLDILQLAFGLLGVWGWCLSVSLTNLRNTILSGRDGILLIMLNIF